jgi:aspartyl protease family protein
MRRALTILAVATVSAVGAAQIVARTHADPAPAEAAPPPTHGLRRAATLTEPAPASPSGTAAVQKAKDGHFWAEASVQGRRVRFLVDTGASTVALTKADARRLGLNESDLTFDQPVSTAAGRTMAAAVTLDYVSVAGARVDDVDALVLSEGLETSLLGMTYLGRLSRFEASRDALILRR